MANFALQCHDEDHLDLPPEENVFHAFAHHTTYTPSQLRNAVAVYFTDQPHVAQEVSSNVLKPKKESIKQYSAYIADESNPPDELCVAVLTRLLGVHSCIYMRDNVWLTSVTRKEEDCPVRFVYAGGLRFIPVVPQATAAAASGVATRSKLSRELESDVQKMRPALIAKSKPKQKTPSPQVSEYEPSEDEGEESEAEGSEVSQVAASTDEEEEDEQAIPLPPAIKPGKKESPPRRRPATRSQRPLQRSPSPVRRPATRSQGAVLAVPAPARKDQKSGKKQSQPAKAAKKRCSDRVIPEKQYGVRKFGPEGQPFRCPKCQMWMQYRSRYMEHVVSHETKAKFICKVCFNSYKRKADLKWHTKNSHGPERTRICHCPTCGKKFAYSKLLRQHMERIHHSPKQCSRRGCTFTFRDRTQLLRHQVATGH